MHTITSAAASKKIGSIVRDLRKQKRMTGGELADAIGVSQSRVSKIENGYSESIDVAQIEAILNILEPTKIIRQRVSMLLFQLSETTEPQNVYPFTDVAPEANDLQKTTKVFRCYMSCGISAALQTVEYRTAVLKRLGQSEAQIQKEIGNTMERQEVLWDLSKMFYTIMPEAALYSTPSNAQVQIAQMDRLERISGCKNVRIGVIPYQSGVTIFETGSYTFYDDNLLYVFVGDRIVRITDPAILVKYLSNFDEMTQIACFGSDAVALIRKASDYFAGRS